MVRLGDHKFSPRVTFNRDSDLSVEVEYTDALKGKRSTFRLDEAEARSLHDFLAIHR
jgi:hypothetical protein